MRLFVLILSGLDVCPVLLFNHFPVLPQKWLSLEYTYLFYPEEKKRFWMLLTNGTVSVSCFGCISHLNFILWYLIINGLQILLWQIFAVIDSFVHCDVLFFGYFPFYLQSIKAVSRICVLIRDNTCINKFCEVKIQHWISEIILIFLIDSNGWSICGGSIA